VIVCHFTEMTSLDQHVLMNMQKVERTGNIVAGSADLFPVCSTLTKVLIFVESCFDIRLCRQCVPGFRLHGVGLMFCSYKHGAMEKLKMLSNGGATEVYMSNSRCVRNNDKPADNNVFTGRLPQHHQWQPHQQQLLMHADDVSQNFLIDSQQSA